VHVDFTKRVVAAAREGGVRRIAMLSFLRARPDCGSGYHESKWAAEEIVRGSGLDWTILKAGVIYGRGDHMLDHLSHAFHTFPVFGLVGLRSKPVRPVAVDDVARVLAAAAVGDRRLSRRTFAVLGPDELLLSEAVRCVADVTGRRPVLMPVPIVVQRGIAAVAEAVMTIPLISHAQVRILAEGIVEPLPTADGLPVDLLPATRFDEASIRAGLPLPGGFGRRDLRWCRA
jgi:NADH dehydrogenase